MISYLVRQIKEFAIKLAGADTGILKGGGHVMLLVEYIVGRGIRARSVRNFLHGPHPLLCSEHELRPIAMLLLVGFDQEVLNMSSLIVHQCLFVCFYFLQ